MRSDGVEVIGWREFASLLDDSLKKQAAYVSGLVGYGLLTLLDRSEPGAVPQLPDPPTTPWAQAARRVADETMDERWIAHSERTWQFATALASRDSRRAAAQGAPLEEPNSEQLYVASLLHDTGLFDANRTKCFAVTGSANARSTAVEAGVDEDAAELVAEAISSHVSLNPGNPLGEYLQAGSLLDAIGDRVWHLDRAVVDKVCDDWPRAGFPGELRSRWAQECSMFPNGRAAFARCPGGFSLATHLAPLCRRARSA
ncbi:hypothetical protein ACIBL3_04425 [Kribbella sp. NPDC050124]|uniref:hypothetical protein n=1 Tax=Kribbella sp. NPDC050124 TaxID=3364114 RepID=UPI0037872DD0